MADERKSILLRIPPALAEQVGRLAQKDLRSVNAQIEVLLREALRARGVRGGEEGPATPDSQGTPQTGPSSGDVPGQVGTPA